MIIISLEWTMELKWEAVGLGQAYQMLLLSGTLTQHLILHWLHLQLH